MQVLLDNGADINIRGNSGAGPLSVAARVGTTKVAEVRELFFLLGKNNNKDLCPVLCFEWSSSGRC